MVRPVPRPTSQQRVSKTAAVAAPASNTDDEFPDAKVAHTSGQSIDRPEFP